MATKIDKGKINMKWRVDLTPFIDEQTMAYYKDLLDVAEYSYYYRTAFQAAIQIGMKILHDRCFGEKIKIKEDEDKSKMYDQDVLDRDIVNRMVNLLEEISLNITKSQSVIYSLFYLLMQGPFDEIDKEKCSLGEFDITPNYLRE